MQTQFRNIPPFAPQPRRAASSVCAVLLLATACSDAGVTDPLPTSTSRVVLVTPARVTSGGALTNGGNDAGTIAAAGQTDSWTFTGTPGTPIALSIGEVTGTATFTPWIRLVAPNGVTIGNSSNTAVAQINTLLPQTGTYTVLAASNDVSHVGTGTYRLILMKAGAFVVPPGDQGGNMTPSAAHTGTIDVGDLDRWTFTALLGSPLNVSMTKVSGTTDFKPWIRLVAPNGTIIGSASGIPSAQININAPQAGTYTVAVGTNDSGNDGSGDYQLTILGAEVTYPFTATWGPITVGGPTGRQVTLTAAIDMGLAPGRPDVNGPGADELVGLQYTLSYPGTLLQYASRLILDPNLDLAVVASPSPGITNIAQTSTQGLTSLGAIQLVTLTYNIPSTAHGTVILGVSFVEVLAGLPVSPADVKANAAATLSKLVIP